MDSESTNHGENAREGFVSWSNILAITAIVISVAGAAVSYWTYQEQRRQWDSTALGRVDIEYATLFTWRTYSEDELKSIDFGYTPALMTRVKDKQTFGSEVHLLTRLDAEPKSPPQSDAERLWAFTMKDLMSLAEKQKVKLDNYNISKEYLLSIQLKKYGSTMVRAFEASLYVHNPDTDVWGSLGPLSLPSELIPEKTYFVDFPVRVGLESPPPRFYVQLRIKFTDAAGNRQEYSIPYLVDGRG